MRAARGGHRLAHAGDGWLALTQTLHARGAEDTYIIMLTMRGTRADFFAHVAGVDDYLTKRVSDPELKLPAYTPRSTRWRCLARCARRRKR